MKKNLLYFFITLIGLNFIIYGIKGLINIVLIGVLLGILASKKNGDYSTWKLIVGIGIALISIFIGVAHFLGYIRL